MQLLPRHQNTQEHQFNHNKEHRVTTEEGTSELGGGGVNIAL